MIGRERLECTPEESAEHKRGGLCYWWIMDQFFKLICLKEKTAIYNLRKPITQASSLVLWGDLRVANWHRRKTVALVLGMLKKVTTLEGHML